MSEQSIKKYIPYSETWRTFSYKNREYHRGDETHCFEMGWFKMKLLDGTERILKPYHVKGSQYSVDIFTTEDDCILMIETILKDQEYIKELESKIKLLTDSLRNTLQTNGLERHE